MNALPSGSHPAVSSGIYKLARVLGYFSVFLGLVELIWADALAIHLGLSRFEWLLRAYGAREVLTGLVTLVSRDPTIGIWLRVIGDALDGGTLGWGYMRDPFRWMGIAVALLAVTPVIIADIYCAIMLTKLKRNASSA